MTDDLNNELGEVKQKILVADDEASIRRILETRLKMVGYDVVTAEDGEEAVDVYNKTMPGAPMIKSRIHSCAITNRPSDGSQQLYDRRKWLWKVM